MASEIAVCVVPSSVKEYLCGLKHDQPESVPSYVSIKESTVCVKPSCCISQSVLGLVLRKNQEIINCPRGPVMMPESDTPPLTYNGHTFMRPRVTHIYIRAHITWE